MIRTTLAATALLLAASPAFAQSQQDVLEARHDRALAAGYKALMLCSAIAIAERNGATRKTESVEAWELSGIQSPHNAIIGELPFSIKRRTTGQISHVAVTWAEDMPARIAGYFGPDTGCALLPIGADPEASNVGSRMRPAAAPNPPGLPLLSNDAGLSVRLAAPFARAFEGGFGEGTRTTATLVLTGDTLAERYAPGFNARTPQRTWSVAKSIAATLIGAAVQDGEANVDEPIGLNYWRSGAGSDPRNAITIDHALRMATGRYSDTPGNRTDPLYFGGSSVDETAINWPVLHKPGTVFRYANNDTLLAVKAIDNWLSYYPPSDFLAKIGMHHTVVETDSRGGYILSSQVWTTARDLARFGQLYLEDGKLASGERVLPEGWRDYVSRPSGPQPPTGTFGYGAGFWLLNKEPGVPADAFSANGNRGQYVVIIPSRQIVIVRRGEDPPGAGFDIAGFTREVLAALDR
ncbi:MAG: serine hydrolase domain-containing protein [Erythrobacter sp.]|jgi:CubicO group peptidase (beta-lactamase class C family)